MVGPNSYRPIQQPDTVHDRPVQ